jgi:hypothetical protein
MNTTSNKRLRLNYPSWSRPRSHLSATDPRNQQTTFQAKTQQHTQRKLAWLAACNTTVRPMVCAGQTGDTGQTSGQSRSGYGEQDFEDSRNTLRGAHSEVIVHQNPPNQEESKKSRKNSSNPRAPKTQNRAH